MQTTRNKIIEEATDINRQKILKQFPKLPRAFFTHVKNGNVNTNDLKYYEEEVMTSKWYKAERALELRVSEEEMQEMIDYITAIPISRRKIATYLGYQKDYFARIFDSTKLRLRRKEYVKVFCQLKSKFNLINNEKCIKYRAFEFMGSRGFTKIVLCMEQKNKCKGCKEFKERINDEKRIVKQDSK